MKHENIERAIDMESFSDNNLKDFLSDMERMPAKLGAFVVHLNGLRNSINAFDENMEDFSHESVIDKNLESVYSIFQEKQSELIDSTTSSFSKFNRRIEPSEGSIFTIKYKENSDKKFAADVYEYADREYTEENEYNDPYLLSVRETFIGYTPVPKFLNKISINYSLTNPDNGMVELMLNHDSDYDGVVHGYKLVLTMEDFTQNFIVDSVDHDYNPHEDFPPAEILTDNQLEDYVTSKFNI